MSIFRDYIVGQRKIELTKPFLIINENITPKLYSYLQTLDAIKYTEGDEHKYCGEIKSIINSFVNYWEEVINNSIIEADTSRHDTSKKELLKKLENTVLIQHRKQESFIKSFLPTQNDEEEENFKEIEELFNMRLKDYEEMKHNIQLIDTPQWAQEFIDKNNELSIKKKNDAFEFTHTHIAKGLGQNSFRIKHSLQEILYRLHCNLRRLKEQHTSTLNKLMEELYINNKELTEVSRQKEHRITDTYAVELAIEKIRKKIEDYEGDKYLYHVEEELAYWQSRLDSFSAIDNILNKLLEEINNLNEQIKRYENVRTIEHPSFKKTCFENMKENLKNRKKYVEDTWLEAAKSLMTFFAVQGQDYILYRNHIGQYSIDSFGHQVYSFDLGRISYHVKCDGSFKEIHDVDKYYYDNCGRYTLDKNGEKLYQCAPCTSTYKLGEEELLVKTTKDCGHSDLPNPYCQLHRSCQDEMEVLPEANHDIDVKDTMSPEQTNFLWQSFCFHLPSALRDTGKKRSKNPIHYMAHRLLYYKYFDKTTNDVKDESKFYRENLNNKIKLKAIEASRQWNAKQIGRRNPDESDDADVRAVYHELHTREQLLKQTVYF